MTSTSSSSLFELFFSFFLFLQGIGEMGILVVAGAPGSPFGRRSTLKVLAEQSRLVVVIEEVETAVMARQVKKSPMISP